MKFFTSCIVALGLALPSANGAAAQSVKDYGSNGEVYRLLDTKLNKIQKALYRNFRNARGISVYALDVSGKDPMSGVYVSHYQNLEVAKKIVLNECNNPADKSLRGQLDCRIYAMMLPRKMDASDTKSMVFNDTARHRFKREYRRKHKAGTFSAFAMSSNTAFGYSNNHSTKEQAVTMAMKFCESRSKEHIKGRSWLELDRHEGCRVIEILEP